MLFHSEMLNESLCGLFEESLTPWLTGAGARSAEGTTAGHENAEGMACRGVRVERPVRLVADVWWFNCLPVIGNYSNDSSVPQCEHFSTRGRPFSASTGKNCFRAACQSGPRRGGLCMIAMLFPQFGHFSVIEIARVAISKSAEAPRP